MLVKIFKTTLAVTMGLASLFSVARADLAEEMRMMSSSEKHGPFIEKFANLVRDKKEKEIIASLDPASIQGASEAQVLEALKKDVFPFFSQFQKMKNYVQVTKAQAQDGRIGLWHYTYMVDTEGNTKPFQIAIIETNGEYKVLDIIVGQCVKGRHPPIAPCD